MCYSKIKMEVCIVEKVIIKLDSDLYKEMWREADAQYISIEELIRDWVEDRMIEIRDKGSERG